MCMPAALIQTSCLFLWHKNVFLFFWAKHNLVFSWCSLNWTAVASMMLPGAGLGVLPFTINPITPTGSTNCDTGTTTLHYSTCSDSLTHLLAVWTFLWMCACFHVCVFPKLLLTPNFFLYKNNIGINYKKMCNEVNATTVCCNDISSRVTQVNTFDLTNCG